jgi:ABC-type glycerol-3-phosphate transport system substrate-binding protein
VLVVDQFEELYTLPGDDEREAFAESLLKAIEHPRSRVRVVVTLRADFFDHPLRTQQLGELMKEHTELVTPMSVLELERAIESPARAVGAAVEPPLLAALAAGTVAEPTSLPMLQYTLTELFERRSGQTMTLESLDQIGGVSGAVVGRAEALFADLTWEGRSMTRQVFLRLVSINDLGADTRRRVLVSELHGIGREEGAFIDEILRTFSRHRLLTFDRDPSSRAPTVEIAHESLLVAWERLRGWIEAAREDLRAQRRLGAATEEWLAQGRDADFLLGGASLARYQTWIADPPVRLTPDEEAFLGAAAAAQASRERVAEEQERRQVALRRRTRALVGLLVGSAALIMLAVIAIAERQRAQDFAATIEADTEALRLVTASDLALVDDPDLAVALAIEAIRATEERGEALPEAVDALHWGIQQAVIEYPADDSELPVTVRPHSGGPRGVFVMTPADLVDLAQGGADLSFTADECERYFPGQACPDPSQPLVEDMAIVGGLDSYMAADDDGPPLHGTEVVFTSGWADEMAGAVSADLAALGSDQGISVAFRFSRPNESHAAVGRGGDPGDLVVMTAPGLIPETLEQRPLVDVGSYLGEDYLTDSYGAHVMSLSRVDGITYAVPHGLDPKSLTFEGAGYEEPRTWDELTTLTDRMVADGQTPWCLGIASGDVTGWMATDWLENFVLQMQGPEYYDRWVSHEIPFDHSGVIAALDMLGVMARTPGYVLPGSISERGWDEAIWAGSGIPPECLLIPSPTWTPDWSALAELEPMRFPAVSPAYSTAMIGGAGSTAAMFDRPETRVAMRALASADWGTQIAQSEQRTWFYPAHRDFDLELFEHPMQRELAYAVTEANDADMFRFDASDRIPSEIGFDALNAALTEYLADPNVTAAEALARVEEAWVELESGAMESGD